MSYIIDLFNIVTAAVAIASVVTATTATPKDNEWAVKAYKVLDMVALNVGKAKD
tara:strand:- start:205 stop:366 length:162 start_codon:yes stop_codon:yes gene_type:complete